MKKRKAGRAERDKSKSLSKEYVQLPLIWVRQCGSFCCPDILALVNLQFKVGYSVVDVGCIRVT